MTDFLKQLDALPTVEVHTVEVAGFKITFPEMTLVELENLNTKFPDFKGYASGDGTVINGDRFALIATDCIARTLVPAEGKERDQVRAKMSKVRDHVRANIFGEILNRSFPELFQVRTEATSAPATGNRTQRRAAAKKPAAKKPAATKATGSKPGVTKPAT